MFVQSKVILFDYAIPNIYSSDVFVKGAWI